MKKVLALVLAVMMLSTMAFAEVTTPTETEPGTALPGDTIKLGAGDFFLNGEGGTNLNGAVNFTSEYFTISRRTFESGNSMVESVEFDDDEGVIEIKLKQDYEQTVPKAANLVIKELDIRCKKDTGNAEKGKTYKLFENYESSPRYSWKVGYTSVPVDLLDEDVELSPSDVKDGLIEFKEKDVAYSTLYHDYDDGLSLEVRVYDGDEFYLGCDTGADVDVLKANADSDADLYFYNFKGEPTFNSTARLYFYDVDETGYIYEVKNGKLTEVGDYSEDDGCWVVRARTLGQYVASTEKLVNADKTDTTEPEVTNPDTGANDVVGIAAALGVVALISGAAVSLKK